MIFHTMGHSSESWQAMLWQSSLETEPGPNQGTCHGVRDLAVTHTGFYNYNGVPQCASCSPLLEATQSVVTVFHSCWELLWHTVFLVHWYPSQLYIWLHVLCLNLDVDDTWQHCIFWKKSNTNFFSVERHKSLNRDCDILVSSIFIFFPDFWRFISLFVWRTDLAREWEGKREKGERRKERISSCWFTPQMATMRSAGPDQSQEAIASSSFPHVQAPYVFGPSSRLLLAELKGKQLALTAHGGCQYYRKRLKSLSHRASSDINFFFLTFVSEVLRS